MCQCVLGLVCRTEPGCLSGDNQVCAVGGWRLHLHSQHQAGENGGCLGENHSRSGEGLKDKLFVVDVAIRCFCLMHLLSMLSRWEVQCVRLRVTLPPTDRPSPSSQGRRMATVYTWDGDSIMSSKASPTVLWLTGSLTSSWLAQTKSSRSALTHDSPGWPTWVSEVTQVHFKGTVNLKPVTRSDKIRRDNIDLHCEESTCLEFNQSINWIQADKGILNVYMVNKRVQERLKT